MGPNLKGMVGPSLVFSFTQALTLSAMDKAAEVSSLLGHYHQTPEGLVSPLSGLYCPRVHEVFAPTWDFWKVTFQ